MMIQRRIDEHYEGQIVSMSDGLKTSAMEEIEIFRLWNERRWEQVQSPPFCDKKMYRVIDRNGKPFEIEMVLRYWPLEEENTDLLFDLDLRIAGMFRIFKELSVQRPPLVAYKMFFFRICERDIADGYNGNLGKWSAVNLALNRLYSTSRVAARFVWFDDFGPLVVKKEGSVVFHYTRDLLAKELTKRGLMKRRTV